MLEVHFLGQMPEAPYMPEAQGESRVEVRFIRFLRPERKFATVDELKAQIDRDCAEALSLP